MLKILEWVKKFWELPEGKQFLSGCIVVIAVLGTVIIYQNNKLQNGEENTGKLRDQMVQMERTHREETIRLLQMCDSQKTAIRIEEKADLKQQIQEQREIMNVALRDQQSIMKQIKRAGK